MRTLGASVLIRLNKSKKNRELSSLNSNFSPPLKSTMRLKEIMTRHYFLARYATGVYPVAWVTSGAPVELLRALGYYTIYPENHGAFCGVSGMGVELCKEAELHGFSQDICSYARVDLGYFFSGKTPTGYLPKPDLLFASNNICQTVLYWYKALAYYLKIPFILFDTPYNYSHINKIDIDYMVTQAKDMIPTLERVARKEFNEDIFKKVLELAKKTSLTWGKVLATMKHQPAPMTIFDAFVHLAPVVSLRGLSVSLDYYRLLLKELNERVKYGIGAIVNEQKRLMWDNIAIWFKTRIFSKLFAEYGMNFVAATYTNAWAETIHYLDSNDIWNSLAKAYSLIILNNNLKCRLALMEKMIKEYNVDGLVIHSARSCKPYSVGQYDIHRILMERLSVSSVLIEADIVDSRHCNNEHIKTRLETFFEVMKK